MATKEQYDAAQALQDDLSQRLMGIDVDIAKVRNQREDLLREADRALAHVERLNTLKENYLRIKKQEQGSVLAVRLIPANEEFDL